jgi:formate dehydrogenase maturation protein FdhE
MKCWHCNAELIWGGDHDLEKDSFQGENFAIVTNLSCPQCKSFVEVYYPRFEDDV